MGPIHFLIKDFQRQKMSNEHVLFVYAVYRFSFSAGCVEADVSQVNNYVFFHDTRCLNSSMSLLSSRAKNITLHM